MEKEDPIALNVAGLAHGRLVRDLAHGHPAGDPARGRLVREPVHGHPAGDRIHGDGIEHQTVVLLMTLNI